jgi:hypothetical protein
MLTILRGVQTSLIVALVVACALGAVWGMDKLMDIARQQVHRDYASAIEGANTDIDAINDEATKFMVVSTRLRDKAVADYKKAMAGKCPLSAVEAEALSRIN